MVKLKKRNNCRGWGPDSTFNATSFSSYPPTHNGGTVLNAPLFISALSLASANQSVGFAIA